MRATHSIARLACVALAASVAGCGSTTNPHGSIGITGTVLFDGRPMQDGHVTFLPAFDAQLMAGCPVKDGRFSIAPRNGLPPGDYRVSFSVIEETGRTVSSPDPLANGRKELRNAVADGWTEETSTQIVTIRKNGSVAHFSFDVPRAK